MPELLDTGLGPAEYPVLCPVCGQQAKMIVRRMNVAIHPPYVNETTEVIAPTFSCSSGCTFRINDNDSTRKFAVIEGVKIPLSP